MLLVALARALGIPARPVHGLVYARYEDGQDALYWHAWAEVRSAGEWIAMDPTFGQPVADATHVALGVGTQVDTVGLLGALKVLAVEVKAGTVIRRGDALSFRPPRARGRSSRAAPPAAAVARRGTEAA